jgi:exodeoxyribonuclease VII small subunit
MAGEDSIQALSFEEALKQLEHIVHKLETGEAGLEESLTLYATGDALRAHCESKLAAAQTRIEQIQLGAGGQPRDTKPFDVG